MSGSSDGGGVVAERREASTVRARRDALVIAALILPAFLISSAFDLFERFERFSRAHEGWQVDELFSAVVLLAAGGLVFAIRRIIDIRSELRGRRAAEKHARELALHDPLTGLGNRRKLHDTLDAALAACPAGAATVLISVDLDRFKPVNDLHGHAAGDQVLAMVSDRLRAAAPEADMIARMGGDEFALLFAKLPTARSAVRPARRLLEAFHSPFVVEGIPCFVGASIGVGFVEAGGRDADLLIEQADQALYRAKREGGDRIWFFDERMDGDVRARAALELEFRAAVGGGQIVPFFQPVVALPHGEVTGYEILSRWNRTDGVSIGPDVFIGMAEDCGLIGELTESVLRQACIEALAWPSQLPLALNLSPSQLKDRRLPLRLLRILDETGFPPERLEVEITETALVADFESARRILEALRAAGIRIALDDFGTGYSSLQHLRQLPIDKLKIDRSFILSVEQNDESRKIVEAIIGLAHSLGLTTTAEGIEARDVADWLVRLGCDHGQGYLYGRPAPHPESLLGEVAC